MQLPKVSTESNNATLNIQRTEMRDSINSSSKKIFDAQEGGLVSAEKASTAPNGKPRPKTDRHDEPQIQS